MSDAPVQTREPPATPTPTPDQAGVAEPVLELGPDAWTYHAWARSLWDHRGVTYVLARKDFQTRYKRATLGVLWAVAVPLVQAAVMIFVFSHFVHAGRGVSYAAFVLSGVLSWGYFSMTLPAGTTAIVDASSLTDKLWFPRAILPIVPCVSNLVSLGISMVILLIGAPILGEPLSVNILLLIPACVLLVLFTMGLTMCLSALHVYFRDVKFITTAALMVWLYATPIMYPQSKLGALGPWLDFNPLTGIISLFHAAVVGHSGSITRAVAVSLVTTLLLIVISVEAHRRHDRLFVDLL
jgi:lipopolysaccharide transport system permease protein